MNNIKEYPLVSIITPCYNGEGYVARFLDSALNQVYPNLELVFVNDGSTDRTEEIINSYVPKFQEKNIAFHYFYQKNAGAAAALNLGLKMFRGEYLMWADSDDELTEDNVSEKVAFFENNPSYNIVMSEAVVVDEVGNRIGNISRKGTTEDNERLFGDIILEKNAYVTCGTYMAKSKLFFESFPARQIYVSRGGQNWQILLPLIYSGKCGYIPKELYVCYAREDSHSREIKSYEELITRCDEHQDILLNTIAVIKAMPQERKEYWNKTIKQKYYYKKLSISSRFREKENAKKIYESAKTDGLANFKMYLIYLSTESFLICILKNTVSFTNRVFRKVLG